MYALCCHHSFVCFLSSLIKFCHKTLQCKHYVYEEDLTIFQFIFCTTVKFAFLYILFLGCITLISQDCYELHSTVIKSLLIFKNVSNHCFDRLMEWCLERNMPDSENTKQQILASSLTFCMNITTENLRMVPIIAG